MTISAGTGLSSIKAIMRGYAENIQVIPHSAVRSK
jgi:hypothetical protein